MAQFNVVGFEELEKRLLAREAAVTKAIPAMLEAGAAVLIEAQKREVEQMDIVDKYDLMNSIGATKILRKGESAYTEVFPQGKDRKGVRNATKGFIAQYGKSNEPARPWMTVANEKSAAAVHEAMRAKWEELKDG